MTPYVIPCNAFMQHCSAETIMQLDQFTG